MQAKSGSIAEIVTKTKETAEKAAQQQAEIKKNAKASKVNIKELAPSAGKWSVDPKIDMDTLTTKQTAAVSYLKAVSEISGMNITLMSGVDVTGAFSVENGHYDGVTNTLYVSVNAGMQSITDITGSAILKTASHEITHYIAASGTQTYSLLEDYVLSRFTEQYGEKSVDNRIEDIQEQYKDQVGKELTREQAKEEMVAAACEMMLKNSEVFEKLARQNLTLAQRIKAGLDGFIKKLSANRKAAFENLDATSPEARAIAASEASLKETQKLWDNALKGAIKENEGKRAGKDTMLELRDEGRYNAEYEKPITSEDTEPLRSIGRKNIKDFTSEDIAKTQKWAYKFYRELGTKSPFFRASFGEWRAYDTHTVDVVSVPTIDISQATLEHGNYSIDDTGWNVYAGKTLNDDTRHHSGGNRVNVKSLNAIDYILKNAILLDTVVSEPNTNKKSANTAFLHKLYTLISYDGQLYIAKSTVEEFFNISSNDVARKAYNLKAIKIEPAGGQIGNTSSSSVPVTGSTISISNLYNLVKTNDKDFSAGAAVNPILLNKDGTPKVFYHGAKKNGGFTEFRPWQYFTAQKNYAQRYAERGNDNSLYAVYLRADKAFDTRDAEAKQIFENIRQEYGLGELQDTGLPDWTDGYDISDYLDEHPDLGYDAIILDEGGDLVDGKPVSRGESIVIKDSSQIKSATDNIGTFDKGNRDILYQLREVTPVEPSSEDWTRSLTTAEAKKRFPDLWDVSAEESDTRNPTQVKITESSYRKIYDILKQEGFDGTILDASSGLGHGTRVGIEDYGFKVDDIEPYPSKDYSPKYTDYSKMDKTYDAIISNAVLNVLPQDQRDALVVKMGQMLNPGGQMFINVRGDDVLNASSKEIINRDNLEVYITKSGSYQKGFTRKELAAYLQDALGDGYTVRADNRFGKVSAVVTKAADTDVRFELRSDENRFNPRKELSNLFMQIAQNEQEKKSLRSYQAAIHELNNTEIEISKLQREMQGTDKLKSPQKYYELQNKLRQAEAKLNRYDGRLVQLEATKPMKDLIARREQRLKEQFARSSTTRAKYRNNIKKNIRSLDKKLRANSGQKHVLLELQPVVAQLLNVFTENTSVFKKEQLARLREIYAKFNPEADSKISSDEKEVTRWKSTAEYSSAYSEMIYDLIEEVRPLVQGKRLIDLDTELLAAVNDIVGNIKQKSAVSKSLPRRRFSVVDQSEHFTAKPPLKKCVFVRTSFGGGEGN